MSTQGFRLDPSLLKLSPAALLKKYEASTPEERVRLGFIRRATPQEFTDASQPKGAPADFGGAVYTSPVPPVVSDDTDPGIPVTPMPTGVSFQKQNATGSLHLDTSNPPAAELLQSGARTVGANMGTPAQSGTTVPLFFPGETSPRDVPYEEMHDNLTKYGAKPGVIMKFKDDPEQKSRAVPADQVQEASKAGGTIIPLGEQPVKQPGFWQRAYENSGLQGMVEKGKELYNDPDKLESLPYDLLSGAVAAQAKQFPKALEAAKSGDLSTAAGRTLAGVTPIVGPMAADTGEKVGTDLGTGNYAGAAGDIAGLGATLAAPKVLPKAAEGIGETKLTAPVRALMKGTNKALVKAPGAVGATIGGTVGAASKIPYGFELGTGVGSILGKELLPQVKLPGEGFGLPNRVTGGPTEAPDFSPPQAPPDVPPSAAPVDPNPSPGAAPLQMTPATPKPMPKAVVEQQLSDALGGQALKPNVPLRNQMGLRSAVSKLPEGFTPIENSSALKGYKYDPATQEFDAITKDGQRFRHGEVSPAQFDAFQRADSAGKAWAELRKGPGVTPLGKVNAAGKVQPRIPSASASASPDTSPTPATGSPAASSPAVPKAMPEDLTTDWSKALDDLKAKQDRRVDTATRQKVTEMSPEDMRKTLLTSDKVDLPNKRAFQESDSPFVGMSDADGLKAFNDTHGYEAGDGLLKAKAKALQEAGLEAYHDKGDEFLYRANSPEELSAGLEKARERFKNSEFTVKTKSGAVKTFQGTDFSYGIGKELGDAENSLTTAKAARKAAGASRERGDVRGIVEK